MLLMNKPKVRHIRVKTHQCIMCGDMFIPNVYTAEARRQLCSVDNFWYEKAEMMDEPNVARIGDQHYIIGEPNARNKGMGGNIVTVIFNDGRVVVTDNLWHQGTIPLRWREWLYPNAKFKETA